MYSINIDNKTFNKTRRLDIMAWSDLNAMSDEQVYTALEEITGLTNREDIDRLSAFASCNPRSCSFDFPTEDQTRALLGAFQFGYIVHA